MRLMGRKGKNTEKKELPYGTWFTCSAEAAMEFRALEHPVHVGGLQCGGGEEQRGPEPWNLSPSQLLRDLLPFFLYPVLFCHCSALLALPA